MSGVIYGVPFARFSESLCSLDAAPRACVQNRAIFDETAIFYYLEMRGFYDFYLLAMGSAPTAQALHGV